MAKISSYQIGVPDGSDIIIGTDVQTGQTKNFSINAISSVVKDSNVSWQFKTSDSEGIPERSSIYFPSFGGNNTLFQNITELMITPIMKNSSNALPYLQSLVGDEIFIQNRNNLGQFGVFTFNSLILETVSGNYLMNLTFVSGNGGLQFLQYYSIAKEPEQSGSGDKTFVYEQGLPASTWVITHDLEKFPSVTVVDSANSTVEGGITYNNENELTLTFSAAFSGKAYLN
tara:strand:- start:893 stop:1579 length:687 start_codon:yes stop_codon:yes gene_type:complete